MAKYHLDEQDVPIWQMVRREFARLLRKVDTLNGPGVSNNKDTITIATPQTPPPPRVGQRPNSGAIRITSEATGGGKYNGTLLAAASSAIALTGNVSLGSTGESVLVLNTREEGASTHDLDVSGDYQPTVFIGVYVGQSDESPSRRVFAIDGVQQEDCT